MKNSTNAQTFIADAALMECNDISLKLYNLTQIVKMAAFAAEARRTLSEVQDLARCTPEFKTTLYDGTSNPNNWAELEDNTADVLDYVARQLEKVNGEFTANLYDLADEMRTVVPAEADKIGGAQ